jgi:excisionase family DNA binding protein
MDTNKRVTVPEIARELGLSVPTIYNLLHENRIPHLKCGHLYVVSRPAFDRWVCQLGQTAVQ